MYQEVFKYCLKVWSVSTALVIVFVLVINLNQEIKLFYGFLVDYFSGFGIQSLSGYVIGVTWFRFKFEGEIFIKRLLIGVLATLLTISAYVHFTSSIGQSSLLLFLVAMIVGTWYFELPMNKRKIDKREDMEDILDA